MGLFVMFVTGRYGEGQQGGGYGAPYQLEGVVGTVFGQTYTQPVYMGSPELPVLLGVVWADFKSSGDMATGCTNACETNSYGVRGGMAGAQAVWNTGLFTGASLDMSQLATLAKAMYQTYKSVRSALNSPNLAVGMPDGAYAEVLSCRYYGSRDGGCVEAGGAQPLLYAFVSPSVWPGDAQKFHYYVPGPDGSIAANSSAAFFVDQSWDYTPVGRPWYVVQFCVCVCVSCIGIGFVVDV